MGTELEVGVGGWGSLWLTGSRSAFVTECSDDGLKQVIPQVTSHGYARLYSVRVPGIKQEWTRQYLNLNKKTPRGTWVMRKQDLRIWSIREKVGIGRTS